MHGNLPGASRSAINSTAENIRKLPDTTSKPVTKVGSSAKVGTPWFPAACLTILGKDAGYQLHKITGFPERSCYRWASGESAVPDDFLRTLFHSEYGGPFHAAYMHGNTAPWWLEHQRSIKLAAASERFIAQFR